MVKDVFVEPALMLRTQATRVICFAGRDVSSIEAPGLRVPSCDRRFRTHLLEFRAI